MKLESLIAADVLASLTNVVVKCLNHVFGRPGAIAATVFAGESSVSILLGIQEAINIVRDTAGLYVVAKIGKLD